MIAVGLVPTHTGEPGGKQTGQRVTRYIEEGGSYDTNWMLLAESGFTLEYQDRYALKPIDVQKIKVRYACPACSIHVWGKPDLHLVCADCEQALR